MSVETVSSGRGEIHGLFLQHVIEIEMGTVQHNRRVFDGRIEESFRVRRDYGRSVEHWRSDRCAESLVRFVRSGTDRNDDGSWRSDAFFGGYFSGRAFSVYSHARAFFVFVQVRF